MLGSRYDCRRKYRQVDVEHSTYNTEVGTHRSAAIELSFRGRFASKINNKEGGPEGFAELW